MKKKILNGIVTTLFFMTIILGIAWIFTNISGWYWFVTLHMFTFVNELTE